MSDTENINNANKAKPAYNLNVQQRNLPATHRAWVICLVISFTAMIVSMWTLALQVTPVWLTAISVVLTLLTATLAPRK